MCTVVEWRWLIELKGGEIKRLGKVRDAREGTDMRVPSEWKGCDEMTAAGNKRTPLQTATTTTTKSSSIQRNHPLGLSHIDSDILA